MVFDADCAARCPASTCRFKLRACAVKFQVQVLAGRSKPPKASAHRGNARQKTGIRCHQFYAKANDTKRPRHAALLVAAVAVVMRRLLADGAASANVRLDGSDARSRVFPFVFPRRHFSARRPLYRHSSGWFKLCARASCVLLQRRFHSRSCGSGRTFHGTGRSRSSIFTHCDTAADAGHLRPRSLSRTRRATERRAAARAILCRFPAGSRSSSFRLTNHTQS